MNRRRILVAGTSAAAFCLVRTAAASSIIPPDPTETIGLWPGAPPGAPPVLPTLQIAERSPDLAAYHDRTAAGVAAPILSVFRPKRPDGSAVLIAPGGGYQWVVLDKEGFETGPVLADAGVTVFVLRYRLPADGWTHAADVPLQDAQRSMRLIRARAAAYGIDPARVGILGFSAGGHVAASLATRFAERVYAPVDGADTLDPKPAFVGLLYPVITMAMPGGHETSRLKLLGPAPSAAEVAAASCQTRVGPHVSPTFIALAADDTSVPPATNGIAMYQALQAAGVPAELHVFEEGGHGFGLRLAQGKPAAAWLQMFLRWGVQHRWFRSAA